ncbi:PAS domain-containing sensor histidine kinase [Telmatobacter bradus]|uniref:PAS domain-containing sensor histidine kinase n=1 Tax=Telmatobacter bradus TaxID=474953 RepID=UPI003B4319AA
MDKTGKAKKNTEAPRSAASQTEQQRDSAGETAFLAAIVASSTNAIVASNILGKITAWNCAAEQLFGYTAAEALGKPFSMLLTEAEKPAIPAYLKRVQIGEILHLNDVQRICKDGSSVDVSLSLVPVRDAQGKYIGNAAILTDITEKKRAEQELKERARHSAQLAAIVESSPNAIVGTDLEGCITSWNKAAEMLYGYSASEVLGQAVTLLYPSENDAWLGQQLSTTPRTSHCDAQRRCKDGSLIDVSLSIAPVLDEYGIVIGTAGIHTDIRERKRAEERLRLVIECSPNAKVLVNAQNKITLANQRLEEMFGYRREDLLGHTFEMLIPPRFHAVHAEHVRNYLASPANRQTGVALNMFGRCKNGTEIRIEVFLSHFELDNEKYTLAAIADITSRHQAEQELQTRTHELLRSNRDLEQFAYAASHDLKEPLRAVAGCVMLLREHFKDLLDDRARQYIRHTVEGVERMQQLIDDLLAYSRLSRSGELMRIVPLDEALNRALECLSATCMAKQITIHRLPLPEIRGIPSQLSLLLQNLLSNAIKFSKPEEPGIIRVSSRQEGHTWIIAIEDNGIGIEEAYFERIFEIFQRLHTRSSYPGTGVGLALCKRIMERHGGRIWVDSTPGVGSTFSFSLPQISLDEHDSTAPSPGG